MTLRYGELFAGAGGLSLGLERAGLECAWHVEIDANPRAVLKHRWPDTPLYRDVMKLDGATLVAAHGPIDILTGGSPCQDLSVAGKRAGLVGSRSSLFHHQMRLWSETGADLCLWENVYGALSSNDGKDFSVVLGAFVGAAVFVPSDGWRSAGVVAGPAGVAAWRCLDCQWFGPPQRRLRVFVLGTRAGSIDPAAVLLEPEGVRGNPPTRREAGEGSARAPLPGAAATFDVRNITSPENRSRVEVGRAAATLHADPMHVLAFHHTQDPINGAEARGLGTEGMGVVSFRTNQTGAGGPIYNIGVTDSLAQDHPPAVCVTDPIILNDQGGSLMNIEVGAFGCGDSQTHGNEQIILASGQANAELRSDGVSPSLTCLHEAPIVAGTLAHKYRADLDGHGVSPVASGIPRRLTPRECERLMGWPDDWALVPGPKGKPMSDAARYKMIGNGVAAPVVQWIAGRLLNYLNGEP